MADVSIVETCACGATFRCSGTTYRSTAGGGGNLDHRSAEEMAERWRVEHKHTMPAAPVVERPRLILRGNPRIRVGRAFTRIPRDTPQDTSGGNLPNLA